MPTTWELTDPHEIRRRGSQFLGVDEVSLQLIPDTFRRPHPGLRRTLNRNGTAEGMVRISLREWYVLTVGGSDHPSTPLVLIKCWLPCRTLDVGNHPTAGSARDTIRDTK
jgi:hypothetical protein